MNPRSEWNANELFETIIQIEKILPRLEIFCAEVCTELSGIEVSPAMFRRLGGMWLVHLAHQITALDRHEESHQSLERMCIPWDSWSHARFFVGSHEYRSQILGLVRNRENFIADRVPVTVLQADTPKMSLFRKGVENAVQLFGVRHAGVVVSLPYLKIPASTRLRAVARSRRVIRWDDFAMGWRNASKTDLDNRRAISRRADGEGLEGLLRQTIPLLIPVAMAEGLCMTIDMSLPRYERPSLLYSANGSQLNLRYQTVSAVWGELGTRILSHQHGGCEGLDLVHAGEDFQVRASHIHYSFGWSDHRSNIRVLPTAMPPRAPSRVSQRLLQMTLADTHVVYRLQPFCVPTHVQKCASETRSFLSELTWPTAPIVRGSHRDIDALQIKEHYEAEGFEEPGSLSASASSLVIVNYLGTPWLETLAMNVPTVCFIPSAVYAFRPAARPIVEKLQQVGILHYSGRDAARFVNSFKGDPSAWWNSAEVQEAREAFVARYANFSDNWLEAWQTEFESLLAE